MLPCSRLPLAPTNSLLSLPTAAGSSLDFMRVYGQLAARLGPLMMKRRAFPTASHAGQLLGSTASMCEAERAAVEAVQALAPPSSSDEAGSEADGGAAARGTAPAASLQERLDAAVAEGSGEVGAAASGKHAAAAAAGEQQRGGSRAAEAVAAGGDPGGG